MGWWSEVCERIFGHSHKWERLHGFGIASWEGKCEGSYYRYKCKCGAIARKSTERGSLYRLEPRGLKPFVSEECWHWPEAYEKVQEPTPTKETGGET